MGKYNKMVSNIIIGLWLTGSVYAQNIKIDRMTIPIKKELIDNVKNKKETIHKDKETETIIAFMSNLDNEEIKTLLKGYGYKKAVLDSVKQEEDSKLYQTIREMNKKYGNPKITPKWSSAFNGKNYQGQFSPIKNMIHINPKIYNNKQEMLAIRLAELSHAKQYQEKGMMRRVIKDGVTWIQDDFQYKELYNQKWTIEYEAHKIIEPEIINEFLELYASKIDTTDAQQVTKADIIFNRFTYTKKWWETLNGNLEFMLDREDERDLNKMKNQIK